jgi:hypothetical protein
MKLLDYYLHNSTFNTLPEGWGKERKNKKKSLPVGRLRGKNYSDLV